MSGVDYREYIASSAWAERRRGVLSRQQTCEACGAPGTMHKTKKDQHGRLRVPFTNGLEVHHVHYRNLGCEEAADLIVLCWECHERTHEELGFKLEVRRIAEERNERLGY